MNYDREEREERGERGERGERDRRERKMQKPIRYTYRYQKSPKTPEVHGVTAPKFGEIISTKAGPAKVLEVFWRSATDADVLLQPVESKTVQEKLAAQDAAKSKKAKPQAPKPQAPKPQAPKPQAPKAPRTPKVK